MRQLKICIVLLLALSFVGLPAIAQKSSSLDDYLRVYRGELKAKRDSAVRALLQLSDSESKTFWPIQQAYDKELFTIAEDRLKLVREFEKVFDKLTDEQALSMAQRFFEIETQRSTLRQTYFKRIAGEVSPVIAVQFMQLQRQFETMADLELSKHAPLAMR